MNREILLHTIRLLLLLILIIVLGMNFVETYKSSKKKSNFHLYPIKGNTKYCWNKRLDPAYMPTECYLKKNNRFVLDPNRNCKCVHKKTGLCIECYPPVKHKQSHH